jgi:hypothetical protein
MSYATPVRHWLEYTTGKRTPYSCVIHDGVADCYDSACGMVFSLQETDRYTTTEPFMVTCKRCLSSYQFGQGNWRERMGYNYDI